jgi:hypothetical protein
MFAFYSPIVSESEVQGKRNVLTCKPAFSCAASNAAAPTIAKRDSLKDIARYVN